MNTINQEVTVLSLTGDGYGLSVSREAIALEAAILADTAEVTSVSNEAELETARTVVRSCAKFRTTLEASRTSVKQPVLELGKKIDEAAKRFGEKVLAEESRITSLGKAFAMEQERIRREEADTKRRIAEEAARKAAAEARAAQAEADKARAQQQQQQAELSRADQMRIAQENEARRIAAQREAARLKAEADAVASAPVQAVVGAKMEWDFELEDVHALYAFNREFVDLSPKRAFLLKAITNAKQAEPSATIPGIRIIEKVRLAR